MATKKTTSGPETSTPKGAAKPAAKPTARKSGSTGKPASAVAKAKAEPVVLDPPKRPSAADKKPDTIDVKATEVAKDSPTKASAAKPAEAAKPAAPTTSKTETPAKAPDAAKPADQQPSAEPPRRAGFLGVFAGLALGGALAAGIGYFGAGYINPVDPDQPDYAAEISRLSAQIDDQAQQLEARVAALEAARENASLAKVEEDIAALKDALAAQSANLSERLAQTDAALAQALQDLEDARARLADNISTTGGELSAATSDLIARYGAEIDLLKTQLTDQLADRKALEARLNDFSDKAGAQLSDAREKLSELTENASAAAQRVDLTLARERLKAAVATGKSYADQLAAIAREAAVEIPAALKGGADNGVVTMLELQQTYPDAARKALKSSIRAEAGEGVGAKLTAFLQSQLGARSLEERDGDDPDAILSQAEAALGRGDLQAAVDLVLLLPAEGQAEMATWLADAQSLLAVQSALEEFNATLDANDQDGN